MIKVTNVAPGPRGVNARGGAYMLRQGETVELDMDKGEIEVSTKTGWFTFEGQSEKQAMTAYEKMSDDELRDLLKQGGVTADGRWGRDRLIDEAKKLAKA